MPPAVVLGPLHVSCFVTAANRATPVFDVEPDRRCIRVVTKAHTTGVHVGAGAGSLAVSPLQAGASTATTISPSGSVETPTAEWEFHSVFASSGASTAMATHCDAFYREITQPAFSAVLLEGINTNILATGIHPTQKFRLLFGKSASSITSSAPLASSLDDDKKDVLELHGQLGGLLFDFFHRVPSGDWRLGLSSWIIVNNQAVDLLKPQTSETSTVSTSSQPAAAPLSFASIEAPSLAAALQILQTAKTQRIVMKHTAEHSHFFFRLAFFETATGQLSTLHVVDMMDLKDFRDAISTQEKQEFYEILHNIRQQKTSMATTAAPARSPSPALSPKRYSATKGTMAAPASQSLAKTKTMLLSNFLQPLLTSNAKTFLYANVIDSRASLRESVALLNAVANVKGFACVCKKLTGIEFVQLGFQAASTSQAAVDASGVANTAEASSILDSAAAKAMAAVAIGESLLNQLAASSSSSSSSSSSLLLPRPQPSPRPPSPSDLSALPSPVVATDAMSWLEAFKQRKKDILTTTASARSVTNMEELPLGLPDPAPLPSRRSPPYQPAAVFPVSSSQAGRTTSGGSSSDLYARLTETIQGVSPPALASPVVAATRPPLRHSSSLPHRLDETLEDPFPPLPQPQMQTTSLYSAHLGSGNNNPFVVSPSPHTQLRLSSLENAGLPSHVMMPPNVDGLDPLTAAKVQAADTTLLRKNYDALLTVVREQQQLREAAEARAREVSHDHDEFDAQYQVQLENAKLEVVALKSKVRMLEKQTGCVHVFDQYEHEMRRLQREVHTLRMQNVDLELRVASPSGDGSDHMRSPGAGFGGGSGGGGPGSLTELKKKYLAIVQDKEELEKQVAELRKRERQFHAQHKLITESTRKVDRLSRELTEKDDALVTTRLGKKRLSAEVALAQQETQQLQEENERLLIEKAATTEELLAAKMYLASIESEQKKAEMLDKFVRKHGDRMQRIRGLVGVGLDTNYLDAETWRRDAQARENEEKLFQGVKRAVPQLVPLANKVLRKLELQELSLREYAEREVDFINLLVELASDQPAQALKAMIEDEMKKLSLF